MRAARVLKLLTVLLLTATLASCSRTMRPVAGRGTVTVTGNLYAADFDGVELNAAGRAKIDAMPAGPPAVLVIHLTRATDRNVFVRRARDVRGYATVRGLADPRVQFDPTYEDEQQTFAPAATATACVADDNR